MLVACIVLSSVILVLVGFLLWLLQARYREGMEAMSTTELDSWRDDNSLLTPGQKDARHEPLDLSASSHETKNGGKEPADDVSASEDDAGQDDPPPPIASYHDDPFMADVQAKMAAAAAESKDHK